MIASHFETFPDREGLGHGDAELARRLALCLGRAHDAVRVFAARHGVSLRQAALALGVEGVVATHRARGLFP